MTFFIGYSLISSLLIKKKQLVPFFNHFIAANPAPQTTRAMQDGAPRGIASWSVRHRNRASATIIARAAVIRPVDAWYVEFKKGATT